MIPVRVDRILHIDRIDAKIRSEIQKADIVVADLTYARPSVYWEAGFAERQVPVIYTCRSDHFKNNAEDKYGNLQVHFDLRNANITTWSDTGSRAFQNRLRKMLLYVSRSLVNEKRLSQQQNQVRASFGALSQTERVNLINQASVDILPRLGYRIMPSRFGFEATKRGRIFADKVFWKHVDRTLLLIRVINCRPSFTLDDLRESTEHWEEPWDIARFVDSAKLAYFLENHPTRKINSVRRILLLLSIGTIPNSRINRLLPHWRKNSSLPYYWSTNLISSFRNKDLPTSSELIVSSGIKSVPEYKEEVIQILNLLQPDSSPILHPSR
jgi:hypothetical protein